MVRVVVKLRPEQYDELFHHVRLIGSTLSEFLRETAASAMAPPEQWTAWVCGLAATTATSTSDQKSQSQRTVQRLRKLASDGCCAAFEVALAEVRKCSYRTETCVLLHEELVDNAARVFKLALAQAMAIEQLAESSRPEGSKTTSCAGRLDLAAQLRNINE
jgi:hypothetical protein